MNVPSRHNAGTVLAVAMLSTMGWSEESSARYEYGDFEISGEIFVYSEARWGNKDGPEEISLAVAGRSRSSMVDTRSVMWPTSMAQLVAAGSARSASR